MGTLDLYGPEPEVEVAVLAAAEPCCTSCEEPLEKYFSVDVKHGFCGETCINPSKEGTYKIFEKNLTKADSDSPCIQQFTPTGTHYTEYSDTDTHGIPGLLAVTLDLYGPEPEVEVAVLAVAEPCCKSCEEPLEKYFSVDVKHAFCNEICINPSKEGSYKISGKNLTKADSDSPCIKQLTPTGTHYTEYSDTVTHGIPGLLAVTLDLYGPELEVKVAVLAVAEPCCNSCEEPLENYFSVDVKHGFCGETCINSSKEGTYKIFEKNLTKADSDSPCIDQFTPVGTHYTEYSETVTHGIPGLLAVTLDLYGPGVEFVV